MFSFQEGFLRLKDEGIPIYAITGNHDIILKESYFPPQKLFERWGLKLLTLKNYFYYHEDILICGVAHYTKTQRKILLNQYKKIEEKANEAKKSILVSHQGIDKFLQFGGDDIPYEVTIDEVPKNFNYYAMGHIHSYINQEFGKGRLVYPGSMEIWRSSEYSNYLQYGKGFCLVDFDSDVPEVERVTVDLPRKFIKEYIDYNELDSKIAFIKGEIENLDEKPILDLEIGNGKFNPSEVYEKINKNLKEYALVIRPRYYQKDSKIDVTGIKEGTINSRAVLVEAINKKYGDERINGLAIDLLENLSKSNIDNAKVISDTYYDENYKSNDKWKQSNNKKGDDELQSLDSFDGGSLDGEVQSLDSFDGASKEESAELPETELKKEKPKRHFTLDDY